MIKAIFCDFYGTVVFEDNEPVHDIIDHIYKSRNNGSVKDIGRYWYNRFTELCTEAYEQNFRLQRELELQSLQDTLEHYSLKENAVDLCRPQFDYWMKPPIFYDSKLFFKNCPVPIYIVSNIDTADLITALNYHGINPAGMVTSEEARAYKPRVEIFDLALRKFGLKQNEVIHVGDSLTSDVLGAKTAGITPVWLNRKERPITQNVDYYQPDLTGILSLIEKWKLA